MQIIHLLLDLLFPKKCLGCGRWGLYVCLSCKKKLKEATLKCFVCKKETYLGLTHISCVHKNSLDGLYGFYFYTPLVKRIITSIKFRLVQNAIYEVMTLVPLSFIEKIHEIKLLFPDAILLAVPLHQKRIKKRGFNQSLVMAKYLASIMNIPICETIIERINDTPYQSQIHSLSDRKYNIKNAFRVVDANRIINRNIILFDDVYTTGSTLLEMVNTLKKNKSGKIYAITFAKTS